MLVDPPGVLLLFVIIVLVVLLVRNRGFHESTNRFASEYCNDHGLQFLDGTVMLRGLVPDLRQLAFRRSYRFEYSINGTDRHHGMITLSGHQLHSLRINPDHLDARTISSRTQEYLPKQ